MRDQAVTLLEERGLQGFANSVRLDDALRRLEDEQGIRLTHGSIYGRIWIDQRDFQLDVVATALARYDGADVIDPLARALAAGNGARGPELRPDQLAAALRVAATAARSSRRWNLWLGARTATVSTPEQDDDERLADALETVRTRIEASVAEALAAANPPAVALAEPVDGLPVLRPEVVAGLVAMLIGASLAPGPAPVLTGPVVASVLAVGSTDDVRV